MSLELEVIALRHQLSVLQRKRKLSPVIVPADRFIWIWLYCTYPKAIRWMRIVKPETVIEWHRRGFLLYWRCRSNRGHVPWKIKGQLRRLIIQMYNENAGWGAGRIQGELLKLGYNVTKRTVAKYLAMYPLTPTPGWRTFLRITCTMLLRLSIITGATAGIGLETAARLGASLGAVARKAMLRLHSCGRRCRVSQPTCTMRIFLDLMRSFG